MDPLSIPASCLAVITAVQICLKTINAYRKAPKFVEDISNELICIEGLVTQMQDFSDCSKYPAYAKTMEAPLKRAASKISCLNSLLGTPLSPQPGVAIGSRLLWALNKNGRTALRDDLRAVKGDLTLGLELILM